MPIELTGQVPPEDIKVLRGVQVRLLDVRGKGPCYALGNPGGLSFPEVIEMLEAGITIAHKLYAAGIEPGVHPNSMLRFKDMM